MTTLGEFELAGTLGEGGSGIVYDARWGPRRVALKVLHAALVPTDRGRTQFLAEARRLQAIAHPSVVKVLAVGTLPDQRPYLAMERLEGETIAGALDRGPMTIEHALGLFADLCGAVGALHDQGLIHRDLKPENVFVVGGQHAVLLDFGIAKELSEAASTTTQEGVIRGTPAYMAPERFFGQPASIATDIYELAVTLYAMLSGGLPWQNSGDPELRLSPRPLESVPRELDAAIRRALSTRAENRPGSAAVLLEMVRAAVGGLAAPAPADTARLSPAAMRAAERPTSPGGDGGPRGDGGPGSPGSPRSLGNLGNLGSDDELAPGTGAAAGDAGPPGAPWRDADLGHRSTVAAPTVSRRRRWRSLAIAGVAAAGAAATVLALAATRSRSHGGSGDPRASTGSAATAPGRRAPDPWAPVDAIRRDTPSGAVGDEGEILGSAGGAAGSAAGGRIALDGPTESRETGAARAAALASRLPADTRIIVSLQLAELRGVPIFEQLLRKLVDDPRMKVVTSTMSPCITEVLASATWLMIGAPSFDSATGALAFVSGRWQRADVERCLVADGVTPTEQGRYKLLVGGFQFLDDHTLVLSTSADTDHPAAVLARPGAPPPSRLAALLANVKHESALALAIDGMGKPWPDGTLPTGTDLRADLRVEGSEIAFTATIDPHDATVAKDLERTIHTEVDPLLASEVARSLGQLDIRRAKTVLSLTGHVSSVLLSAVAGSVAPSPSSPSSP